MRTLAGPSSEVHFTHLSKASSASLTSIFSPEAPSMAKAFAHQVDVLKLMESLGVSLNEVCLLDPKAEKELSPEDGNGACKCFLFGVS